MKNVHNIEIDNNEDFILLASFDKNEIDNLNNYAFNKINYHNRLNKIISIIKSNAPNPKQTKIADIGCAQGNLSLLLAEMGYTVYALDLRQAYLEYSKLKYEKGDISWICGNITDYDLGEGLIDIVILGELIEHCAFPKAIISNAMKLLKPGGIMIITTPNGEHFKNKLPLFSSFSEVEKAKLSAKQFGPDGGDHLFLFVLDDFYSLVENKASILSKGYIGSSLINHFILWFLKVFPVSLVYSLVSIFEKISVLNRFFSFGMYCVIRK